MTDETDQAAEWAVIELMGHNRYGGRVSKDTKLSTPMLRVDVPQTDGTFATQLINPSSIYRITFCEESIARAAAEHGSSKPIETWKLSHVLAEQKALEAPPTDDHDEEPDDEELPQF
jgi:hypothetical protein